MRTYRNCTSLTSIVSIAKIRTNARFPMLSCAVGDGFRGDALQPSFAPVCKASSFFATSRSITLTQSAVRLKTSRLTKKFDGDDWKLLVELYPKLLRDTFVIEVSTALHVKPSAIAGVELRLGSLYVTFHVTHDEDITQEEIDQRVEEYPFREMWRLYNQRDSPPDGLDAALARLKEMERQLEEKDREYSLSCDMYTQQATCHEREIAEKTAALENAASRERELLESLAKEQQVLKKADAQVRTLEEEKKHLLDVLKKERVRFDKSALHQNELVAAIIQENKKEKEAKEREYKEQHEAKDYIIDSLRGQLRTHHSTDSLAKFSIGRDPSEEFSKLMSRMEELALLVQRSQDSGSQARAENSRLLAALRAANEGREADSVMYENNLQSVRSQLRAFSEAKIAEDKERRRAAENCRKCDSSVGSEHDEGAENEAIVQQYQESIESIIGTVLTRLDVMAKEFASQLSASKEEIANERRILEKHEEDSHAIRQTFHTSSMALQKVFWSTREREVSILIDDFDTASTNAERSSAAVKIVVAMLESRTDILPQLSEWMERHQQSLKELMTSLSLLSTRAFDKQLTQMRTFPAATQ